ncbi:hypothetical protein [Rugamonas sp.]|uniref:hypothetical protein n=1 Tax=Rugamonas sp. TaxID=1926287 RepID=UPI0025FD019C|nr:hypothetical protein [Rugamonas sp.]
MAIEHKKKITPTWTDVKMKLAEFDRAGLIALVQDMYSNKENQAFLHARFGLGVDTLKPYKATISRWMRPDLIKHHDISVSKAKKAISDYKKAVGHAEDVLELMIFYCEEAAGFSDEFGMDDEGYFDSLLRMFVQVLRLLADFPMEQRNAVLIRLDQVRKLSHKFGYGVGDEMDDLLEEYVPLE